MVVGKWRGKFHAHAFAYLPTLYFARQTYAANIKRAGFAHSLNYI